MTEALYATHQGDKALAKNKTPEPPSHPGRFVSPSFMSQERST
jgi:hypothetical protein